MEPKLNVALVHGAWADGSSWDVISSSETESCFCVSGQGLDREHLEWRDAP